ncbi:regulatory protein RecX [Cellulomonas sp. APG4]|uniref:regulatory protein RecX n=1 Tax=Cellulomonas sp. APG4 TaxID=1538656 RepID=UPI00351B0CF0
MARKDVPDDVAERVLDRFTEVGLIDDAEYARMLVRSRGESRGLARRALAAELRRKGVGDDEAQEALATVDDETEIARARALLERRWPSLARLDPQVRARRALGMLGRKGYPAGLASRLVRELEAEDPGSTWEPWGTEVE